MTQSTNDFLTSLHGSWKGPYSLWLQPGADAEESESTATFRPVAGGVHTLLEYGWRRDDQDHRGAFYLGGNAEQGSASWGDSFHMSAEPMVCEGPFDAAGGKLTLLGSWSTGPGEPAWGWRSEFTLGQDGTLLMEAFVITPDGREAIAVRAPWTRVED